MSSGGGARADANPRIQSRGMGERIVERHGALRTWAHRQRGVNAAVEVVTARRGCERVKYRENRTRHTFGVLFSVDINSVQGRYLEQLIHKIRDYKQQKLI